MDAIQFDTFVVNLAVTKISTQENLWLPCIHTLTRNKGVGPGSRQVPTAVTR